ncbi:ABC transporter permease [Streptomyces corynorhini]|uniref:ABC transporter permease n=1 Tax=Streptomyces corynorhini TaxID=2282652 RepID=A0A370AR07_9ACTN|nr:ABC transporter permease [Streptomyces corynorhini]RDG32047.1 ABC transporter permease [Streptomyces corynorhini]
MRLFLNGFTFQLRLARTSPDTFQVCVTAPLYTLIFLSISEYGTGPDLTAYAIVAPTLMSLWILALSVAGTALTEDRDLGTLEGQIAAPAPMGLTFLGRMCSVVLVGLVAFAETWLVAGLVFGRWLTVPHPVVLGACLLVTGAATAGTAGLLSPLFMLTPSARTLQNTFTFPFYLLGGVLVPVDVLPHWIQPASRVVFLSWGADLMRDSLAGPAVHNPVGRLLVVLLLGAAGYGVGMVLLNRVVGRVRRTGTLSQT